MDCSLHAPAPKPPTNDYHYAEGDQGTGVLGLIPHQLRGYLGQFRNMHIVGAAYDKCTGCSETVRRSPSPALLYTDWYAPIDTTNI
jgi:ubiquitin-like modifier-activating enzyme ATG7